MNVFATALSVIAPLVLAAPDGEADNLPDKVRPVPPPGVRVPDADRDELEAGLKTLTAEIAALGESSAVTPDLFADVEIYAKAVRYALHHDEFFNAKEIPVAKQLIHQGLDRAASLRGGKAPWASVAGLVARGYVSKIDGSVQPYGLVVPASFAPGTTHRFRLDTWFHGRGETLSELNFIDQRQRSPGEFTPKDAFVLHLYGRYCCANKLAGEIDLFEALESVQRQYPIDADRIVIRGFSMGGAASWQFAVHYADQWCAAAPGAGFSETPDFLRVFQRETLKPAVFEQTLWHMYDATDYAANLFNLPTVAYSGEIDSQKQAADVMAAALEREGITLAHIVGPKTGHKYEPAAKAEINRRIDAIAERGRNPVPARVRFTTWTLRYHRMFWVRVSGLEKHWERARVEAEIAGAGLLKATTENVTDLAFVFEPGQCPLSSPTLLVDGQEVRPASSVLSDRSWSAHLRKAGGIWRAEAGPEAGGRRKRPGLQGPIDDAFLDGFVMVRPTGAARDPTVEAWVKGEMAHAIEHWRKQFRGDARVIDDVLVTPAEIARHNLILWGDASANQVIARIAGELPLADLPLSAPSHVPLLIYPNPLNPERYVVLNSGFTFREYDYLNNARQVPKLPDWAVIDTATAASSRWPGKVVAADFFDESWQVKRH